MLADVFGVDIYGYAVMSNHYHIVLSVDPTTIEQLSDEEIAERWLSLSPVNTIGSEARKQCENCGGPVRIIASIEDPDVIQKILTHLGLDLPDDPKNRSPPAGLTDQQTTLS